MRNKIQKAGYSLVELLVVVGGIGSLALLIAVIWVAIHFLRKFW